MKKCFASLLCAALLLALSACGGTPTAPVTSEPLPENDTAQHQTVLSLPYTSADTLNPFQTRSRVNKDVADLLFDPLFQLDASFEAVPVLAADTTLQETSVTVKLRDDVRFSTGELLTARDVVYSFQYAKESPMFSARLENVFSASADADDTVRFTLRAPDRFVLNCLDFPVVKFSTGEEEIPVGTGRYLYRLDGAGKPFLLRNEQTASFDEVSFEQMTLYDIRETVHALPLVEIGQLTCYLLDPAKEQMEKVGGHAETVHLNNLVYCGMNSGSAALQNAAVRKAIGVAVDRSALAQRAFDGMAQAAQTPFQPQWNVLTANMQTPVFDTARAAELLEKAGYTFENERASVRSKDGEPLSLRLLVNSENRMRVAAAKTLREMLAAVGIAAELESIDYESYLTRLKSGGFDLYLGEVKLPANMSLSAFFSAEGGARYGVDPEGSAGTSYADFCSGSIELSTFVKVFAEDQPFVPLCFRDAALYYTGELSYEGAVSENAIYGNLYSWSM